VKLATIPAIAFLAATSSTPIVNLGAHRFGHTQAAEAVVARAAANEVGWQLEGDNSGPETFLVGSDRSIWLHDEVNHRLLIWNAGQPQTIARTVTLPFTNAEDVAFGPANTLYFDRDVPELKQFHLYRMSLSTGAILWHVKLAPGAGTGNTSLRTGPDGTLYAIVPHGRWMPVATPAGKPLSIAAQLRSVGSEPVRGGLRLVETVSGFDARLHSYHAVTISLVNRAGKTMRAWRINSRTDVNLAGYFTPDVVGGDPVVVLDVTAGTPGRNYKWEYEVLRLTRSGASVRFSLRHAVFGDNLFADVRVGPDGKLYQLSSSPQTGVQISRYSLR
jgi:hypothetical protein